MLSELLIGITVLMIMFTNTGWIDFKQQETKTLDAATLLTLKFKSINSNKGHHFNVSKNKINTEISTTLRDCELRWSHTGNASKAGTCLYDDNDKITLKVGDGGVGYSW